MGVPAPQQQRRVSYPPLQQQQKMAVGQESLSQVAKATTPVMQLPPQQQQQVPRPPVPLPVVVPVQISIPTTGTAGTSSGQQVPLPYPPPVTASPTGPNWVSSPVQQEQLARLFVQGQGGVQKQVQGQAKGGVPVTQQQQQQQHPPAQQPQLQQQ